MRLRALCAVLAALAFAAAGCGDDGEAQRASGLAKAASAEVDAVLAEARALLAGLAEDPAVQMPDLEHDDHAGEEDADRELAETVARSRRRCAAAVRRAAGRRDGYEAVGRATVDGAGIVDCISRPLPGLRSVGDRMLFMRAYNSARFAVGDYQFDGARIGQSIGVGLPIEGAVLFALVDLEALWRRLSALSLPEGADIVVVDGNGTVIARPQTAYAVGRSQAGDDALVDAMLERESGTGRFEYERRERTYAFAAPELAGGSIRVAAGVAR